MPKPEKIPEQLRDLDLLSPEFRKKVDSFLEEMQEEGDPMEAHETIRTEERQKYLLSTGASKVKHSNHQDGVAVDLHFKKAPTFPPSGHPRWVRAAKIAKKHGIDCGGIIWNGFDWNHFQDDGIPVLPDWKNQAIEWAQKNSISNGDRPEDSLTRVEAMELLRKFAQKFKL